MIRARLEGMNHASSPSIADPQVAVAVDGSLIAHLEPDRITLIDGEAHGVIGEIGIDPEAEGCDVALCGDPLRLIVLARYAANGRLHVIDPRGPSAVGEVPVKAGLRMAASSGNHVWLIGAGGSVVVDVTRRELTLNPLALRSPVAAVGAFTDGRFVVSTGGMIEEWDGESRSPARRFRLAKATTARFVGGGTRQVWIVPADADRIELIPLVNVGQPARIELPEPIGRIAADPPGEMLAVVGATTGAVYVVELAGKTPPLALEGVTGFDVAWLGTSGALLVAGFGLEVVQVGGRPRSAGSGSIASTVIPIGGAIADRAPMATMAGPGRSSSSTASARVAAVATGAVRPARAASGSARTVTGDASARQAARSSGDPMIMTRAGDPMFVAETPSIDRAVNERLTAWRERTRATVPRATTNNERDVEPAPPGWRDELASWARAVVAGTQREAPGLDDGPAPIVAERLGLHGELAEAVWLIYGAHLCGVDGVAAIDLIQVIGRRWDEALGRGRLAASGALRWRRSRVRLRPEVIAALDESPPRHAMLIDSAAEAPGGAVAVIAGADSDLAALAVWIAPQVGPLLVAEERGGGPRRLARHLLAARVRGALPVLRWPPSHARTAPAPVALLVVADEDAARAAQAAVIATWPPPA